MPATLSPSRNARGFIPLDAGLLSLVDAAPVNLYLPHEGRGEPPLYCASGRSTKKAGQEADGTERPDVVLVKEADLVRCGEDVLYRCHDIIQSTKLPQCDRFSLLLASASSDFEHARQLIKPVRVIERSKRIADGVASLLEHGQVAPEMLFHAPRSGSRYFVHSANVACYATLLAIATGVQDKDDLRRIAQGGMLHDLGLWKPMSGMPSADRKEAESRHPQLAYELMCNDPSLDRRQLMMLYQHHERPDGEGWPVGVLEEEIHPWAKLLAVVDVFDDLTNPPAGRNAMSAVESFSQLRALADAGLDKELVQCWMQVMAKA